MSAYPPCQDPPFETQMQAERYGSRIYYCMEGHFHAESPHAHLPESEQ